jgi:hypothetical protein
VPVITCSSLRRQPAVGEVVELQAAGERDEEVELGAAVGGPKGEQDDQRDDRRRTARPHPRVVEIGAEEEGGAAAEQHRVDRGRTSEVRPE